MPTRVIAFFLVLVLVWTGLGTVEAPQALASHSAEQQYAGAPGGGLSAAHEGSVEHHHLDDLPLQAQNDPPTETPGLLPALPPSGAHALVVAQPRGVASTAVGSPFLAGPLRPPCSATLAG